MSRIFWDTNIFIYFLEGSGEWSQRARQLLDRISERDDDLYTSTLTLGEVLVKPLENGQTHLAERYERLLNSPAVNLVNLDPEAARIYARIRLDRTIEAPDAVQLACASAAGINLFVTNDSRLCKKSVPGIDFIVPLAKVFL